MNKLYKVLFFLIFVKVSFSQSFLNGSFEINTAATCDYNQSNAGFTAKLANSTGYGLGSELDIFQSSCGYGTAQNGNWMVGLAAPSGNTDAFTTMLNAPLMAGNTYTIQFYDKGDPTYPPGTPIKIGLSTVAGAAGTLIYTGPVPLSGIWSARVFSFVAPNNGQHISISTSGVPRWTHVDNFTFVGCSTPTLSISPSSTICLGSSKTLTVSGASSYTWNPAGSLSISSGSIVIATPTVNTTYTVIGANSICTTTAVVTITVTAPQTLTITPASTICNGESTSLTVLGSSNYTWSPGASLNSISLATVIASPTVTTIYNVIGSVGSCSSIANTTVTVIPNPIISITPSLSAVCLGSSSNLLASGATTYTWIPSVSLNTTSGAAVIATPTTITSYTVIGTSGSCTSTAIASVSISVSAPISISASSSSICVGETSSLTVTGANSYTWSPVLTLSSGTGSFVVATPIISTNYSVVGQSTLGCLSNTFITITVISTPTVIITPSLSTICLGTNKTLVASGATTYIWSTSSSLNTLLGASVIATPTVSSTYTVTGSIGTCTNSSTATVNVVTPAVITASASPSSICSSQSSTLSASGGVTYLWSPGAGLATVSGSSTNTTPNVTTTYTVLATDALGCVSSASVTVTVTQTPTLTLSASSLTICEGATTNLQTSGASNYLWSPSGSLSSSTLPSVIATPAVTTMYIVIGNNGICTDSKNIQITVIPKIIPAITPNDTAICFGKTIQLSASGGSEYLWSPASTLSSPTSANVIAKPLTTTIYTVSVSINNNCPQTKSVKITVNPLPYVYAGVDTTINIDESYVLNGTGDVTVGFVPLDGNPLNCNYCSSVEVNPKENTCYTLKGMTNFGCENSDDICITVTKDYNIYIPNAFTPNGDIDNEFFIPVGYGLSEIKLFIFDRWGVEIFRSSDENLGWDGKVKGKACLQGVYV